MHDPQTNLIAGINRIFPEELFPWDEYYMSMAYTDWCCGRHNIIATKSFFIRKAPFKGSFAILGGLTKFLAALSSFEFNNERVQDLMLDGYSNEFCKFLREKKFLNVRVYSMLEGSVFFPHEPVIVVSGDLLSIRLIEGMILRNVNFPTLSLTKWQRVVSAAAPGAVLEFARRRAQNDVQTSLCAYLAGCSMSANRNIRSAFDIPTGGTMGHEWIQSFGNEFDAFDKWLEHNPHKPVLLLDTVSTLKSGLPNSIRAFKKHMERIIAAGGVPGGRIDSGDLAYLSIEGRRAYDDAGIDNARLFLTNDLDEYSIQSIKEQIFSNASAAGILREQILSKIIFGCGTVPGNCSDQPSLGGVMKLGSINVDGLEKNVIKLANDNVEKTSIPGFNFSAWALDENHQLICSVIYNHLELYDDLDRACSINDQSKFVTFNDRVNFIPRHVTVFDSRVGLLYDPTMNDVRELVKKEVGMLHWTTKRLENPHSVKVSLSPIVFKMRDEMIKNNMIMSD